MRRVTTTAAVASLILGILCSPVGAAASRYDGVSGRQTNNNTIKVGIVDSGVDYTKDNRVP